MTLRIKLTKQFGLLLSLFVLSGADKASADELPFPPTYFSNFRIDFSVARDVAENCPTIEIDRKKYAKLAEEQIKKLEQDGFSRENWRAEMKDIPVGLRDRPRVEFYMAYGVTAGNPLTYCNAGEKEIARKTTIGLLLKLTQ